MPNETPKLDELAEHIERNGDIPRLSYGLKEIRELLIQDALMEVRDMLKKVRIGATSVLILLLSGCLTEAEHKAPTPIEGNISSVSRYEFPQDSTICYQYSGYTLSCVYNPSAFRSQND